MYAVRAMVVAVCVCVCVCAGAYTGYHLGGFPGSQAG